jgi:L-alanine-DL-glutamate epimerase-like enolase superfamily enzyme
MKRRSFLGSVAAVSLASRQQISAAIPKMKITRVRAYAPPNLNPLFNQSNMVITVETDAGITGIGEGGSKDTIEQCAGRLIGKDPQFIEKLWQDMYRSFFYPPGREKIDALGGLDLALWDLKGKVLNQPVHALLGGLARNYCGCYITGGVGGGPTYKEKAQTAIAAGYRAFRMDAASVKGGGTTFNARERIHQVRRDCEEAREGVGKDGDWLIDFHQRFDFADALRGCKILEDLEPFLVEDPVRTEAFLEDIPKLRRQTTVPLAAGEEWGQRWDFNKLVENHDIDYVRATLPNVGGITEMRKIAAICETHFVGIVPHFTGPIAEAALVHVLGNFPGPVLFEYNYQSQKIPHLPLYADFKDGKLWPNERPGLGVELDLKPLKMVAEITQPITDRILYYRPDGSITNW